MREDPADRNMFKRYFRVTYDEFKELLYLCKPSLIKENVRAISPEIRLALTLRYLATGMSQRAISLSFLVGPTTACNIIRETVQVLWKVLVPLYLPAPTTKTWRESAQINWAKCQVPLCVGFIDGKHIKCWNFANYGSQIFNYKKEFSLVLLGVCDANCRFLAVDIGQHGSVSDGGTLKCSEFGRRLFAGQLKLPATSVLPGTNWPFEYYFIGDEAFPLSKHIQRPYGGKFLSLAKRIYNARISRGRSSIERAFGILCARWRILLNRIQGSEKTVEGITQACEVLHNFILHKRNKKSNLFRSKTPNNTNLPTLQFNLKDKNKNNVSREMLKYWFNHVHVLRWLKLKVVQGKL